jgi:uncharacterized protein (DUF4213/DUF364 family)
MTILDELLDTLDMDAQVTDIRVGLFHTAVLGRRCGLASTLPRDALKQPLFTPLVREPGDLLEKGAAGLCGLARSESLLEASIGMATVNALIDVDLDRCVPLNAGDLIAAQGSQKRIAIVGHFPFVPGLREIARELWVIEKNPQEGDVGPDEAERLLPRADVVGVTGSTFINHTLDQVLELCRSDAFVVVLGDSTPLSPLLFDHGVDAVSGTWVTDPGLAMRCVSQGATFRQIRGRQLLTMTR